MTEKLLKLNIGGGPKKKEGFKNVDVLKWGDVTDIKHDLTKFPWPFQNNTVDAILMEEFLEHVSFRFTNRILKECHRVLKPNSNMTVQVPDCGKAMGYYVNDEICECVPHKAQSWDSFKADPDCFNCQGKAKINPNRWLYSFIGAQKHPYDIHQNIFTKEKLAEELIKVGFVDLNFQNNPYKVIVTVRK